MSSLSHHITYKWPKLEKVQITSPSTMYWRVTVGTPLVFLFVVEVKGDDITMKMVNEACNVSNHGYKLAEGIQTMLATFVVPKTTKFIEITGISRKISVKIINGRAQVDQRIEHGK